MTTLRIVCTVGTRPEAIKMAPVIRALRAERGTCVRVLATAQHRHLLDQVLPLFDIRPDIDLDVMRPDQPLSSLTARLLKTLDRTLTAEAPDVVMGQGDTTTVLATALACFHSRIPFAHVEAGLRTGDYDNPFPEEMNRVIVGRLARWHFAPTSGAGDNLRREGVPEGRIFVTGNTVIDALLHVAKQVPLVEDEGSAGRLILVTAHRRESFGPPLEEVCRAIRALAEQNDDVQVLYPVHPNPRVRRTVHDVLADHPRIVLCDPLDYRTFVAALRRAYLVLTDSGGIQEEAPALGKPVLVMRSETERPEAIEEGVARLVGTDYDTITTTAQRLLDDPGLYATMARGVSPFGDGRAADRIAAIVVGRDVSR